MWARIRAEWRSVDTPEDAWRFARWLCGGVVRQLRQRPRAAASPGTRARVLPSAPASPEPPRRTNNPLGVEIAALGPRSQNVFRASECVVRTASGQRVDVVLADTAAAAAGVASGAALVLTEVPAMLSVPAFDPQRHNPVGWRRNVGSGVGALGPLDLLPPECGADRVVCPDDRAALRTVRHVADVQAFHADVIARAGTLVRVVATGAVVHLADGDEQLAPYLGTELFALMTRAVGDLDIGGIEALSVSMRRAALRDHSLTSRARQVAGRVLADPPRPPLVSLLLVVRRPAALAGALTAVRRQNYPRLELVLALCGEGFGAVEPGAAGPSVPMRVLRPDATLPTGSVLNLAVEAAGGTLLAKMEEDEVYGPDHIQDLVLAWEYSRAPLVGMGTELVYLDASSRFIRRAADGTEIGGNRIGGTLLIDRHLLERMGGWGQHSRAGVDQALVRGVLQSGEPVYRAHPPGFLARGAVGQTGAHAGADDTGDAQQMRLDVEDFGLRARQIQRRIEQADGGRVSIDALCDLAGKLVEAAPTDVHRVVAGDLLAALSDGAVERARQLAAAAGLPPNLRAEKIVSHRYRYVWLGVPKVASRSLIRGLRGVDPEAELVEGTIAEVHEAHPEALDYRTFTFVRHPFHRALSLYSELFLYPPQYFSRSPDAKTPQRLKLEKLQRFARDFPGLAEVTCFEDYCHWLHTPYGRDAFADRHYLSQHLQIRMADGRLPDFVGRIETLGADLAKVSETLGMPAPSLPMVNTMSAWEERPEQLKSARAARAAHLTGACKVLLMARYRDDLRVFGYSPE